MRPRFTMSVALDSRLLAGLVDAYARHNLRLGYLPPLLRSGVRYDDKGAGSVHWLDASELLAVGRGDCKALTAYALAELWRSGVDPGARAEVCGARALSDAVKRRGKRRRKRKPMVHVYVRLSDGAIWDPSVALGMRPLPRKAYAMSDDTFNHETAELAANTRDTGAELAGLDADELVGGGEAALGGDDDGAGLYDDNDVAQLAGAIEDYNRQTGLALGADDAADEYQAPAPAPAMVPVLGRKLRWDIAGKRASLSVPLNDGRTMTLRTAAPTGKAALARAARELLNQAVSSPVVASLLPPGAVAVASTVSALADMGPKEVARRARSAVSSAARALAGVFS